MASYEASEIMTAAALMYDNDTLKEYAKDVAGLRKLMNDAKEKIKTNKNVEFGSPSIEKGFTDLMDDNKIESLKDLVAGISSAIGIRSYLASNGESGGKNVKPIVYMTGNVWPNEVQKFRVSAYGFEDYNSADLIVTTDKKSFYGISLKKKRKVGAGEPTLINKAFDTILQDKKFNDLKEELGQVRIEYFANLVIEAVEKGIILENDIQNFQSLKNTEIGRKELFEAKKRDKKLFDRAYIDTKGYAASPKRYLDNNTKDPKSMRYFVNRKLAEQDNQLWNELIEVMNKYADLFADSLINIILKIKLYDELNAEKLKDYKFNFFLVTGIGDISPKGVVDLGQATVLPLKTTLCGLTRIEEKFKSSKYEIVLNKQKKGQSDAAKVFMQLKRGNITLLDLELRYKGAFTPQPQFQGTINESFKKLLVEECGF